MKIVFEKLRIQDTLITALRAELSTLKSASPSPALVALETELALRPLKEENLSLTSSLEKATSTIDSLRASISDAQADVAYMRDQYQNASTAAAARAQECFVAETESKRLTSLIDIGMKQYDLIYVAQIDKLKKELARTKGELGLAEEMNERTRGVRKMASLWEEHLAAERLEEAEREERESRMIEERQAAMLLDPIPSNSNSVARNGRNGFDSSDEDDSEDDSDEEALVALVQEVEDGLVDQRMEETQDPDDPDVFVCLWRPGCGEALSSRNVRYPLLSRRSELTLLRSAWRIISSLIIFSKQRITRISLPFSTPAPSPNSRSRNQHPYLRKSCKIIAAEGEKENLKFILRNKTNNNHLHPLHTLRIPPLAFLLCYEFPLAQYGEIGISYLVPQRFYLPPKCL